jgi:phosphoribosylaminoimidazolecarboxamide formyltransferase/IMP cyclohydrolase
LRDNGLPVREVSEITGFPEMLDGRVKTIHPRIAAGILAIRGNAEHMHSLREHDIPLFDMVVVNLYQFETYANKVVFLWI